MWREPLIEPEKYISGNEVQFVNDPLGFNELETLKKTERESRARLRHREKEIPPVLD